MCLKPQDKKEVGVFRSAREDCENLLYLKIISCDFEKKSMTSTKFYKR